MNNPKAADSSCYSPEVMLEKQWVRKVRDEGDRSSFEKLFHAYYKRLHGFAYSYLKQSETAEDVVQSVFLKIWTQRENWDPPGTVEQYFFAAVKNEALNKLRHGRIVLDAEEEVIIRFREHQLEMDVNERLDMEEISIKIEEGIIKLPPRCRQIFLLNRRSGLTYTEIAAYLNVSINTVNTQMGRALKSLRESLSDYLPTLIVAFVSRLFL